MRQNPCSVRYRRLLLVLAVLALTIAVGSALHRGSTSPGGTTPAPASVGSAAGPGATVVSATLPAERVVRARVGDLVQLSVRSSSPDIANMTAIGVSTPVGPRLPGTLQFTADVPGRFPVTLSLAARVAGEVDVSR
ncbi:MAG TPA: hypothetical protein VMT10_12990 [Solirubrobacteraceae bacterium]|nr:hypothetical protein [Thermoleophilia bacterium]HVP03479.1 hypothetical protein [Solirubrobacteraceae bacterium]